MDTSPMVRAELRFFDATMSANQVEMALSDFLPEDLRGQKERRLLDCRERISRVLFRGLEFKSGCHAGDRMGIPLHFWIVWLLGPSLEGAREVGVCRAPVQLRE